MKWADLIKEESSKEYYKNIILRLKEDSKTTTIYPNHKDIFSAFKYAPYDGVKVVILGQDPYHNPGEAHGLSFSVMPGVKIPPSLQNIFKELKSDLDIDTPSHGCLINWARQGVLLLNTILTVKENQPGSHKNIGWHIFTNKVISVLNNKDTPIVFILWGNCAKQKRILITNPKHLILESSHPSPFSAHLGFFGSKPFSKTNKFLISHGIEPINWKLI
jgi:uracil-DNA glycosylase